MNTILLFIKHERQKVKCKLDVLCSASNVPVSFSTVLAI